MPFSRNERRLEHSKAYKLRVVRTPPNKREGADGDMLLCVNKAGMKLYVKYGAEWYIISERLARDWTGTVYETNFRDSALSEAHKTKQVRDSRNVSDYFSISGNLRALQDMHLGQSTAYDTDERTVRMLPDPKLAGTGNIELYFSALGSINNQLSLKNGSFQVSRTSDEAAVQILGTNVHNHADAKTNMTLQSSYSDTHIGLMAASPTDGWSIGQVAAGTDLYVYGAALAPSHGAGAIANGYYAKFSESGQKLTLQSKDGSGELQFNRDKGSAGAANDTCGIISFYGDDANQDNIQFAKIEGYVQTHTNTEEGGGLKLSVASHDGEMVTGLMLIDGSAEDEIDAKIGAGTDSVTTVAGDLSIEGDTITSTGALTVDSPNILSLDSADGNDGLGVQFAIDGTMVGNVTGHHSATHLTLYENIGASTVDKFSISCGANGATSIETNDQAGTSADITIIPDGLLKVDSSLNITEQAAADGDTAGYGQVWVKNDTPNELAFTDDTGTDIVGIGKYHYETKICNFYSSSTSEVYLPIAGYVIERTSTSNNNEYIAMIAPFSGTLEKFALRSEAAQGTGSGTMRFIVMESQDGTEVPGSVVFRKDLSSLSIADDTYTEFDLTSPAIGEFPIPLAKGRIYAFAWTPAAVPYDTNTTLVFKWDVTS